MRDKLHAPTHGDESDRTDPAYPECKARLPEEADGMPGSRGARTGEAERRPLPPPERYRWVEPEERAPTGFLEAWNRGWTISFKGRASRKEYWLRQLSVLLEGGVVGAVAAALCNMSGSRLPLGFLGVWGLAIMVPTWALFVRRLHDGGFPGFLGVGRPLIGILGLAALVIAWQEDEPGFGAFAGILFPVQGILEIIFGVCPSVPETNEHGPNPLCRWAARDPEDAFGEYAALERCTRFLHFSQYFGWCMIAVFLVSGIVLTVAQIIMPTGRASGDYEVTTLMATMPGETWMVWVVLVLACLALLWLALYSRVAVGTISMQIKVARQLHLACHRLKTGIVWYALGLLVAAGGLILVIYSCANRNLPIAIWGGVFWGGGWVFFSFLGCLRRLQEWSRILVRKQLDVAMAEAFTDEAESAGEECGPEDAVE